jgi:hypothetical protein
MHEGKQVGREVIFTEKHNAAAAGLFALHIVRGANTHPFEPPRITRHAVKAAARRDEYGLLGEK